MKAERGTGSAETEARWETGKLLVCFALREESTVFENLAGDRADVQILLTGIGQKNAASTVGAILKNCRPGFVLSCGFAGGLNPHLAVGDVVFATDENAMQARLKQTGARPAQFFCSSRIAVTAAEKAELGRTTGADAVEMESGAIHTICRTQKIPCATVRAISDTANEDMPLDFNQLAKADSNLHLGKLAVALAKSPGKVPALLRLQKNCRFAAERLAVVLLKVIESP